MPKVGKAMVGGGEVYATLASTLGKIGFLSSSSRWVVQKNLIVSLEGLQ